MPQSKRKSVQIIRPLSIIAAVIIQFFNPKIKGVWGGRIPSKEGNARFSPKNVLLNYDKFFINLIRYHIYGFYKYLIFEYHSIHSQYMKEKIFMVELIYNPYSPVYKTHKKNSKKTRANKYIIFPT